MKTDIQFLYDIELHGVIVNMNSFCPGWNVQTQANKYMDFMIKVNQTAKTEEQKIRSIAVIYLLSLILNAFVEYRRN